MKLRKEEIALVGIVICIFAFVLIANVYSSSDTKSEEIVEVKPIIYFDADTDLPDSMLYLKGETINEIYINQTYYINFTIESLEEYPIMYTYVVESTVLELIDEVTLQPKESKSICVEFTPTESNKWDLVSNTLFTYDYVIDLSNDSKIVELKEFTIKDNIEATKALGSFSWLLSSNISINELRKKPLMNEHITEYNNGNEKISTINLINISVIDDKLYLNMESKDTKYISEEQLCSIRIFVPPSKDEIEEIHFSYLIKMENL